MCSACFKKHEGSSRPFSDFVTSSAWFPITGAMQPQQQIQQQQQQQSQQSVQQAAVQTQSDAASGRGATTAESASAAASTVEQPQQPTGASLQKNKERVCQLVVDERLTLHNAVFQMQQKSRFVGVSLQMRASFLFSASLAGLA
jgi:hypothetical protein